MAAGASNPQPARDDPTDTLPLAARRHDFVATLEHALRHRCAVPPGEPILAGISGGADSLAMLIGLLAIAQRASHDTPAPIAVHVQHHLRDSAEDDAAHVETVCRRLSVEYVRRDVYPDQHAGNRAAAARRLRYEALTDEAQQRGINVVAVAHHAHDQLETMLMHLCRGSGAAGLSGLAWRRPLEDQKVNREQHGPAEINLIRPLLDQPRTACESLCHAAGVTWRDDPTNADPNTARGRLRRDVLPVLEALWPGAATHATYAAEITQSMSRLLDRELDFDFGSADERCWPRADLAACDPVIIAAGLRRAAIAHRPAIAGRLDATSLRHAAEMICDNERRPRQLDWPGGLTCRITSRYVELIEHSAAPPQHRADNNTEPQT